MRLLVAIIVTLLYASALEASQARSFRIGLILPLSGINADYGQALRTAIEMARKDHLERYRNIELRYEDAQYDPKLAITAFQKLAAVDKVDLIYVWGVSFCKAVAPLADRYRLPVIGQCVDPQSSRGRDYFIRFQNYTDQYMRTQIEFLAKQKIRKIAVVLTENPYLEELFEALKRSLFPGQELEVVERIHPSEMDLRHVVTRIRTGHYDAIAVFLHTGQISQFYRQASEQQMKLPSFGSNLFESKTELESSHGTMNGAWVVSNQISDSFLRRYRAETGSENQIGFASLAYDFGEVVAQLFSVKKEWTPQSVRDAFQDLAPREGMAAGSFQFRDSPEAGKYFEFKLVVKRVSGVGFETVS